MVTALQIRITGTALLVLGMLILLYGILTVAKNVLATGFVAIIIAVTLLYYARRLSDRPR